MARKAKPLQKNIRLPIWLIVLGIVSAGVFGWAVEYYRSGKRMVSYAEQLATSLKKDDPKNLVKEITQKVIPVSGYKTSLTWGDLGKRLVEVGAIDLAKYQQMFTTGATGSEGLVIFDEGTDKPIEINENNSRFLVNTLWALGLTNKSKVLDEGMMKTSGNPTERFASTAGWTLGTKPAMELYSSEELISLTDEQQEKVKEIAGNVFRPCCGNSTAFPDCNHGMATLGYIELAVASGLSEEQIYTDLLAFNSYWFPTTYIEMGVYFSQQDKQWENVDAKIALSGEYSSAQGAQKISQAVADVPGIKSQGGSCGA